MEGGEIQRVLGIHLPDVMALRGTGASLKAWVSLQHSNCHHLSLKERSPLTFPTPRPSSRREGGGLHSLSGQTLLFP